MGNLINLIGRRFGKLVVKRRCYGTKYPSWLCVCDCGRTKIVAGGNLRNGSTKSCGCLYHLKGPKSTAWRGGRVVGKRYVRLRRPDHPSASKKNGYVFEHILVAEKSFGKPLPEGAVVHHFDGDGTNNSPKNLIICQNHSYHRLLHIRADALKISGNANYRKCSYCGQFDDPKNMYHPPNKGVYWHKECQPKSREKNREKSGRIKKGLRVRERHCNAKLSNKDVFLIRCFWQFEGLSYSQLSKKFHVAPMTIFHVAMKHTWK